MVRVCVCVHRERGRWYGCVYVHRERVLVEGPLGRNEVCLRAAAFLCHPVGDSCISYNSQNLFDIE